MKTSDNGLKVLILREGSRHKAYLDTKGIPTIGVGHTLGVKMGDEWDNQRIFDAFKIDVQIAEDPINNLVKVPLNQNQFDALVSFIFNVGVGAFTRSTLLKVLNLGNYKEAANQFDRWHIPPEITSRRDSEKNQFNGA